MKGTKPMSDYNYDSVFDMKSTYEQVSDAVLRDFNDAQNTESSVLQEREAQTSTGIAYQGRFVTGLSDADYAALREYDESRYDTREQAKNQLISGADMQYQAGGTVSEYESLDNRDMSRRLLDDLLGMPGASNEILPDSAYSKTLDDLGILLPGSQHGKGRDLGYLEQAVSPYSIARKAVPTKHDRRLQPEEKLSIAQKLVDMGEVMQERVPTAAELMEDPKAVEKLDEILDGAKTKGLARRGEMDTLNEGMFKLLAEEATTRGLEDKTARAFFIIEEFQRRFSGTATGAMNGQIPMEHLAEALKQGTSIFGADFVNEAMAGVVEKGFSAEAAYADLPEDFRAMAEANGMGASTFAKFKHISNRYTYQQLVKNTLLSKAGEQAREAAFRTELHKGWSTWTRKVTDTAMTDFGNDPMALYFTVPTVIGGVAAGMTKAAMGASMSLRGLGYAAADGLIAGASEGAMMSISEQQSSFFSGVKEDIVDYTSVLQDSAVYGGTGAVFGAGIGGLFMGAPKALRATGALSNKIRHSADEFSVKHGFGSENAKNRLAVDSATDEDAKVAEAFPLLNPGAVIRLRRGELDALDIVRTSLKNMVEGDDPKRLKAIEGLFDPEELERMGISVIEAVDLVLNLHNRLGPAQTLQGDQLMQIVRNYAKKANRGTRFARTGGKTAAERRIRFAEAALKANGKALRDNFVGGVYKALSDKEFNHLTGMLKRIADGETLTQAEVTKVAQEVVRLNDRRLQDRAVKLLKSKFEYDWAELDRGIAGVRAGGRKAKKDKFLQRALRVDAALDMITNERTIRIAKELGVSPRQIRKYVEELKGVAADPAKRAELDLRYQQVREAIDAIDKDGTKHLDLVGDDEAYNVYKFLDEDESTEGIRDMEEITKNIATESDAARRTFKDRPEELAAALKNIADKYGAELQAAAKKLGMNIDMDTALERVRAKMDGTLPFNAMSDLQKGEVIEAGIAKAIDQTAPDKVNAGGAARDREAVEGLFKGTALGERFGRAWSRMMMWGSAAVHLTRSDYRIVRGVTQLITGQHVTNRVHTNLSSFTSFEAAAESARRVPLSFHLMRRNHRIKLGQSANTQLGQIFNYLRMRGMLTGKTLTAENIGKFVPPTLLKAYDKLGGADELLADLKAMQGEFTTIMQRSIEEAADAGVPLPKDVNPQTYIPHRVAGNVSADKAAKFISDFRSLREKQLLGDANKPLDLETLDSLGWIRITRGGGTRQDGSKVNKEFVVPVDSPFYRMAGDTDDAEEIAQWVRKNVINQGTKQLDALDGSSKTAAQARKNAIELAESPVDQTRIRQGEEVLASADNPRAESARSNGRSRTMADAISGVDEELTTLERARSEIAKMSDEQQAATGADKLKRKLDVAIANRRRFLNQMIRESMADGKPPRMRKRKMSPGRRAAVAMDDETFRTLSDGHSGLVDRLDELMAQGIINEQAKRIIMASFADVDPGKISSMSFSRLDASLQRTIAGQAEVLGDDLDTVIVRLGDMANVEGTAAHPAMAIAETFVHETAHLAFLSSSPKMQRVFQALFNKVKNGSRNDLVDLLAAHNINMDHALSNVHEFVAALAQISLVTSRTAPSSSQRTFLSGIKRMFVKMMKGMWLGDDLNVQGVSDWKLIDRGVRSIFNQLGDDAVADKMARKYGIAKKIDDFGRRANQLKVKVDNDTLIIREALREVEELEMVAELHRSDLTKLNRIKNSDRAKPKNLEGKIERAQAEIDNIKESINGRMEDAFEAHDAIMETASPELRLDLENWFGEPMRAEAAKRAVEVRNMHMKQLDKLEKSTIENLASQAGSEAEAAAIRANVNLDESRMFLASIDPRITADMNIIEAIASKRKGAAGTYFPDQGQIVTVRDGFIPDWMIQRMTPDQMASEVNHTLQHEIAHHLTFNLTEDLSSEFSALSVELFESMSYGERMHFITQLHIANRGKPSKGVDRYQYPSKYQRIDPDTNEVIEDDAPRWFLEDQTEIYGSRYFNSDYYAKSEIEFTNEIVNQMIQGRITKAQVMDILTKGGTEKANAGFVKKLTAYLKKYLQNNAAFRQLRMIGAQSEFPEMQRQFEIIETLTDMATDFDVQLASKRQSAFDDGLFVQEEGPKGALSNDTQRAVLAIRPENPGVLKHGLLKGMQNATREEKVTRINELLRASGKERGHLKDMLMLAAYKLHDEVHGTNKFYAKLQESNVTGLANEIPENGFARAGTMINEMNKAIEEEQKLIAKLGDDATPEQERMLGEMIAERDRIEEAMKAEAPRAKMDEATASRTPEELPVRADEAPEVESPEDLGEFMLYMSNKFQARVDEGELRIGKHDAAFNESLIKVIEEIGDEFDPAKIAEYEAAIFGGAADSFQRAVRDGRGDVDIPETGRRKTEYVIDDTTGEYKLDENGKRIKKTVSRGNVSMDAKQSADSPGIQVEARESATETESVLTTWQEETDALIVRAREAEGVTDAEVSQLEKHRSLVETVIHDFPDEEPGDVLKRARQRKKDPETGKMGYTPAAKATAKQIAESSGLKTSEIQRASNKGGAMKLDEIEAIKGKAATAPKSKKPKKQEKPVDQTDDLVDEARTEEAITEAAAVGQQSEADVLVQATEVAKGKSFDSFMDEMADAHPEVDRFKMVDAWYDSNPPTNSHAAWQMLTRMGYVGDEMKVARILWDANSSPMAVLGDLLQAQPEGASGASFTREIGELWKFIHAEKRALLAAEPGYSPDERLGRLLDEDKAKQAKKDKLARPSDKELRERWEADAQARVDKTQSDEEMFEGMEGPTVRRTPEPISDAELKARWDKDAKARAEREGEGLGPEQTAERTFEGTEGPAGGRGGDEPPKPPAPAGASPDDPGPARKRLAVSEALGKKRAKQQLLSSGEFNAKHRLADRGMSLKDLYAAAIRGDDPSVYSPDYVADMKREGFTDVNPMQVVAQRYLNHASGGYKTAYRGEKSELSHVVGQVSSPQSHMHRTFKDEDLMDEEFGDGIAKLLSTSTSPELLLQQYAEMTLGSIRISKMIKDIFGTEGMNVTDLFEGVEQALKRMASTSYFDGSRGSTSGRIQTEEIAEFMQNLQEVYLRSRGMNPRASERTGWGRGSRIARNLTYSVLGPKFAMSVLFVEAPVAIVKASGLNPVAYAKNSGIMIASLAQAAAGHAMTYKPMADFMSKFGLDNRILKQTLEDMTYEMEQMQSNAFARHGLSEDETATHEAARSVIDRAKK
ncbi:MAG: hypothetical protein GY871_15015, partial [Actinomycetales bacterium]|nr:hypothetical protein [Actinomycetales bacterium]